MESQPQNPEFRNNPENFQPCKSYNSSRINIDSSACSSDHDVYCIVQVKGLM